MNTVPFQYEIRPELPTVYGTLDYRAFREVLLKIDEILNKSNLEHRLISQALEQFVETHSLEPRQFYNSQKASFHYGVLPCELSSRGTKTPLSKINFFEYLFFYTKTQMKYKVLFL